MILNIFGGIIPDIIYFILFVILAKGIETKKIKLFILFSLFYIPIMLLLPKNICANVLITFLFYILMKFLYGKKSNVMDIFLLTWASLIYVIITLIIFLICQNLYITLILSRIIMFSGLFIFKNKISKLYRKCIILWDRHQYKKQFRSITIRNINIVILNISIYIIYSFILLGSR